MAGGSFLGLTTPSINEPILPVCDTQDSSEGNTRTSPQSQSHLRAFANPGPLGLCAFATTTFVLSVFNTQIPPASAEKVILGLALFYGGAVQLVAGIWEFVANNTFGATAFCSYGGFWMSFAYFVNFVAADVPAAHRHTAVGIYLLSWLLFTTVMLVASMRTSRGMLTVFEILEITFILLVAGNFAENDNLIKAGGWFGILTAFAAFYCGMSGLLSATWKYSPLPMGNFVSKSS